MKERLLSLMFLLFSLFSFSQTGLQVQYSTNLDSLVYYFIESGVTFSNVTSTGHIKALGSFSGGVGSGLGIEKGIVLSSGNIQYAIGPNDVTDKSFNSGTPGDSVLSQLLGQNTTDASVLEFDLIPEGNVLAFNYVFGSEEYPEFINEFYNDAFAYFITGPNPEGGYYENQNIALIPETNIMVSINTVNQLENSEYYIDNSGHEFIQYDGMTVVLPISVFVIPDQSYHLKIVIADCGDSMYDSGVFLESPSLKSYKKDYTEPFAQEGAEWHYSLGTVNPELVVYKTINKVSDTLIDDKLCSRMLEQDYEQSAGSQVYHYMYQRNDSVFFFKDGQFHLLYDFGAEAGDTITLGYYTTQSGDPLQMIIDSVGSIMVDREQRRIQYVTCGDGMIIEFGGQVIQGIGNTWYMFPVMDFSYDGPLRCYSDNETEVFYNPFYIGPSWNGDDCDLLVSVNELSKDEFSIYPNPANDLIRIEGLSQSANFRIISVDGKVVKEGRVDTSKTINIRDLRNGLYLMEIYNGDKRWSGKLRKG